ncbi:MAG TPA: hypothetical protein VKR30_00365 [Candidatus Limnocylindrales bacterium]|nr:hypothetical protein [Candidatus Limnocylindrales bacterium]
MGFFDRPDRRPLAVVVTSDGRRVHLPIEGSGANPLSLLRSIIVVIEGLIGLIVGGDRRENGGTRRSER